MMTDDLGVGDETPRERLARQNMEGDLRFLMFLRQVGKVLNAPEEARDALDALGDDPRLSDIRRYAHALGLSISHDYAGRVRMLCHCGNHVAAFADPGKYENPNMVDYFCGDCITVRCDAYPGACKGVAS